MEGDPEKYVTKEETHANSANQRFGINWKKRLQEIPQITC
jgi:hypothetical protein